MSRSHFHPHKLETAGAPPVSGRRPVFLTAPCFVLPGLCLCVTSMRKGERDGGLPTLAPPPLRSVGSAPTCPWPRLLVHRGGGGLWSSQSRSPTPPSRPPSGTWDGGEPSAGPPCPPLGHGRDAWGPEASSCILGLKVLVPPEKAQQNVGHVTAESRAQGMHFAPWPPASRRLLSRPCRWPRGRRRRTGQAGPPPLDFVQWASGPQGRGREEMV